jgi:hypothetical protein
MQSLSRGWSFLIQAWRMAFKDKDLIKPSIYALVVGAIFSVIGILPIIGAYMLFGESFIGQALAFVLAALLMFVNFSITYIFSGMTAYLIFGYLSEGDGRMDKAWAIVKRDFFDILTLAAASTVVGTLRRMAQGKDRRYTLSRYVRSAARLFEVLWTEAAHLILPAMVIDDLNLKDGATRIWNITKANLLLIGISTVGVGWVTGIIGFVIGLTGALIGFGIGYGIIAIMGTGVAGLVLGIGFGVMIFLVFTLVATVISRYTDTAYHTCLYIWARDAEKAQEADQPIKVEAPAPLAAVIG